MTKDTVRTIAANVLEIKSAPITTEILGGVAVKYNCHITVVVDPDVVTAQLNDRGVMRYQRDDLDGATEFFNQAIKTDPLYSAPWSGLGWIHFDRGEYDQAIDCFQRRHRRQ